MVHFKRLLSLALGISSTVAKNQIECKAAAGNRSWPSAFEWTGLNNTLSGALIQALPPGGVCHCTQPNYNPHTCPSIQAGWSTWAFHEQDPISTAYNNWNNDSCLPIPSFPCSGGGYPVYVVNASKAEHVQAAVNFARERNVRLVVKASGHDFMGRCVAPNSVSIWTRYLRGNIQVHDSFTPQGHVLKVNASGSAITFGAGCTQGEVFAEANKYGLMVPVTTSPGVTYAGYVSGGGHSLLSVKHGLAADLVLEMTLVTPNGEIVTANAYRNQDLFWALLGGGGSTFGVILTITIQALPSEPVSTVTIVMTAANPLEVDTFWDAAAYGVSQYPLLADNGFMSYTTINTGNATTRLSLQAIFNGLSLTADRLASLLLPIELHINETYPNIFTFTSTNTSYASYYAYWTANIDTTTPVGIDMLSSSRLLDAKALSSPNLASSMKQAAGGGSAELLLVSGPGVHSKPPGLNSVCPAWRTSYVHFVTSTTWAPLNESEKAERTNALTFTYTEALRKLAPDTGAYLNEADVFEPDFQHTFWGANYPRLLSIKRRIDPEDVLWCHPCVGSERRQEVGDLLCRI